MDHQRLDIFVNKKFPNLTRTTAKKLVMSGIVKVNGEKSFPSYKVNGTEKIEINEDDAKSFVRGSAELNRVRGKKMDLDVIYEDENIILVNKPSGINSHPVLKHDKDSLLNGIFYYVQNESTFPKDVKLRLVHRLDKDTSGVILATKNLESHDLYSGLFEKRKIKKEYYAIVHGDFEERLDGKKYESFQTYIGESKDGGKKMINTSSKKGKLAKTKFYFKSHFNKFGKKKFSLLLAVPETGRTHQIRLHLSTMKHPILGDVLYGGQKYKRVMLHAFSLTIPVNGKDRTFEVKLPEKFIE